MELTRKTFDKGVRNLTLTYLNFEFDTDTSPFWYEIFKGCIPEEDFLDIVFIYGSTYTSLTSLSELLKLCNSLGFNEKGTVWVNNFLSEREVSCRCAAAYLTNGYRLGRLPIKYIEIGEEYFKE